MSVQLSCDALVAWAETAAARAVCEHDEAEGFVGKGEYAMRSLPGDGNVDGTWGVTLAELFLSYNFV